MRSGELSNIGGEQASYLSWNSRAFGRRFLEDLLHRVEERAVAHSSERQNTSTIHTAMSEEQKSRYAQAILQTMFSRGSNVVTPDLLFDAADMAVVDEVSTSEAHVGLQPGTMNPIHNGHISASLGSILVNDLDIVLLAAGATVPDKPNSVDPTIRNEMIRIATRGNPLSDWLHVTPIRQQAAEIFSANKQFLLLTGESETIRRSIMDIAAFIWLFRANPKVRWTYLAGSDKVADYGRLGEYDLIVGTLANPQANVRILYFVRDGKDVDVVNCIEPYHWLLEKWQSGLFERAPLPTCPISARKIKTALVTGRDHVDGLPLNECLHEDVLTYIQTHKTLLTSYAREVQELECT